MTVEINKEIFFTTAEFARLMKYADTKPVRRHIKNGGIPSIKRMDGSYLIPGWYVEELLKKAKVNYGKR